MLFDNANDLDISRVCESSKKNPCLEKIWRRGKGKGSEIYISSMGKGASFFPGGGENFSYFRGKGGLTSFRYKGV